MSEFERDVRKALIDKNMTLGELANKINICLPYLYDILKGNRPAKVRKQEICTFLKLNNSY